MKNNNDHSGAHDEASLLRNRFGEELELTDESGVLHAYRILAELTVNGKQYAVLQNDKMKAEGDIEVFRLSGSDGEGDPELETVEDDDEYEAVSEAYDDLQFGSEERP